MMQEKKLPPSNGIWDQWTADQFHQSSVKLAEFLVNYLDRRFAVYDFGCGPGFYISRLDRAGFVCKGVEGFPLENFLHTQIVIHDLTKRYLFPRGGSVLSFETGEHIPVEYEQIFLDTLTDNCYRKLIMSWATPGQPGIGHVNCRSHEYIIDQMEKRSFWLNEKDTEEIRKHVDPNCDWLERNLLIFDRV